MSVDTELFISEVEKRPALFNTKLKEYSDKILKKKLWIEVFEQFIENWSKLGTAEQEEKAERLDEKLHKRTTVRMGIRVVQRAFAPPSPHKYVPGGGKTSKEQAKMNRKALLFGCQSAPLEQRFLIDSEKSRSVEMVGVHHHHHHTREAQSDLKAAEESVHTCGSQNMDTLSNGNNEDTENKSPNRNSPMKQRDHVTFKDKQENRHVQTLINGMAEEEEAEDREDETNVDNGDRRTPLKLPRPEERMDSVESNEDHISDFYRSLCSAKRPSMAAYLAEVPNPKAVIEKPFLLSDGTVLLSAALDRGIYSHGEDIRVSIQIRNNSNKTIRRIKVFVVQHVDVCMFSNGKFKNVVAMISDKESCPLLTGATLNKTYTLLPLNSTTKNWIALEDTYTKSSSSLASTVCSISGNAEDRNVFAIYVSYYVKVKLLVSVMGGDVSLKLPFTLMHTCRDFDCETLTRVRSVETEHKRITQPPQIPRKADEKIKPEKDGT